MNEDRFIAMVRREIGVPDGATARKAVRAVFETFSERLTGGLIKTLRGQLPEELARDLSLRRPRQPFDADEFVRRIARPGWGRGGRSPSARRCWRRWPSGSRVARSTTWSRSCRATCVRRWSGAGRAPAGRAGG
ncbi:DUF2267 domain-containing protein [Dactylosporangium roseum]|uniref:DUF2267 domain-containing protein n=1 Tax=Dactylosporangium roseum TaxID=47989 RepID=A0ABY5Z0J0_9ACTN|nr:DUF2267 domain-containing protein [Dactylosporangium roseum]